MWGGGGTGLRRHLEERRGRRGPGRGRAAAGGPPLFGPASPPPARLAARWGGRPFPRARRALPNRCACVAWDPAAAVEPGKLRGVDAIVHLAGAGVADARWSPARKRAIRDSRVASTQALVGAMAALPAGERPRHFLCAS